MVGVDRTFRLVTYNHQGDNQPQPHSEALEDVYRRLAHVDTDCAIPLTGALAAALEVLEGTVDCPGKRCPQKDGLSWSPGIIQPGKKRASENVVTADFAVFDLDHVTEAQLEAIWERVDGTECFLHTTHNHKPPHDCCARLVFPLARSVVVKFGKKGAAPGDEWGSVWRTIVKRFDLPADVKAKDPSRLFFLPRSLRGRPFLNTRSPGELLDPTKLVVEDINYSKQQIQRPIVPPPAGEPGTVDLKDLKGYLRRYNAPDDHSGEKKEMIRRILAGEPLADNPNKGTVKFDGPVIHGRDDAVFRVGAIVGLAFPTGTPAEAAMELLRPSIAAIPTYADDTEDEGFDLWMAKAEKNFRRKQEEKAEEEADDRATYDKLRASRAVLPASNVLQLVPPSEARKTPVIPDLGPDEDWRATKMINITVKGLKMPKNTAANITAVLENHPDWKGVLRYNTITNEPEMHGGPIPTNKQEPERFITAICNHLAHTEGLEQPYSVVERHIDFVARSNSYDPLKSYLQGLKWDGVPRINKWLIDYCQARCTTDDGVNVEWYVKLVGEKWLMAGAARALYPGCKADNVLVFEGEQYIGKSKCLDVLGGDWFADTKLNLSDKSALELVSKSWIIEMSELATLKKSETESQKSFFSTRIDNFRLSYAKRIGKFKRRCILAGTTNETRYLLDLTGNRRFWCVFCMFFDIARLKQDRDQLWAEAVALVLAGESCPNCNGVDERCPEHRWWLDMEQTKQAEVVTASRLKIEFADEIQEWWLSKRPEDRGESVTVSFILIEILKLTMDKLPQQQAAIGRALKSLGFARMQLRQGKGNRPWVYVPSEELKTMPQEGSGGLRVVGGNGGQSWADRQFQMSKPKEQV